MPVKMAHLGLVLGGEGLEDRLELVELALELREDVLDGALDEDAADEAEALALRGRLVRLLERVEDEPACGRGQGQRRAEAGTRGEGRRRTSALLPRARAR